MSIGQLFERQYKHSTCILAAYIYIITLKVFERTPDTSNVHTRSASVQLTTDNISNKRTLREFVLDQVLRSVVPTYRKPMRE